MTSIKKLIFEQLAQQPTSKPVQTPQQQQPQQGSARQKELAPYRAAAKTLVNITKGIDPASEQAGQLKAKLKGPMQQFINPDNIHDDKKLNHLFRAIEDESKSQKIDERGLINILRLVGGSVGAWSRRLLQQNYNVSEIVPKATN